MRLAQTNSRHSLAMLAFDLQGLALPKCRSLRKDSTHDDFTTYTLQRRGFHAGHGGLGRTARPG